MWFNKIRTIWFVFWAWCNTTNSRFRMLQKISTKNMVIIVRFSRIQSIVLFLLRLAKKVGDACEVETPETITWIDFSGNCSESRVLDQMYCFNLLISKKVYVICSFWVDNQIIILFRVVYFLKYIKYWLSFIFESTIIENDERIDGICM